MSRGRSWTTSNWGRALLVGAAGLAVARFVRRAREHRRLRGQVALVTGASRGLGYLLAEELARAGCRLVICARGPEELARAREALGRRTQVLAVTCDLSRRAEVDALVTQAVSHFGRIDLLVNNAGIIQVGSIEQTTLEDFQRVMATDFWGAVHATLAVLPHMRRQRSGRIVNITSIGGKVAVPRLLPYDCAKFASIGFSEGLRAELARDGISVTTVIPGLMRTGSERFAQAKTPGDARWFSVAARMPGLTVAPRRAARKIMAAVRDRRGQIVVGVQAKVLRLIHDFFPSATTRMLDLGHRLLPGGPTTPAARR
jgi:NAD(P)-dependent dehydrogenase (short-subunit alcohol dehydrogenase family)